MKVNWKKISFKKEDLIIIGCIIGLLFSVTAFNFLQKDKSNFTKEESKKISGTVMKYSNDEITIQDDSSIIYTFSTKGKDISVGDYITVEYTGILNKNNDKQDCKIIGYQVSRDMDDDVITNRSSFSGNDLFANFYTLASNKLKKMTLDEKIGQTLLIRYPDTNQLEALKKYHFAGFVFFEKDFKDKSKKEVKDMINLLQKNANISLLTAVDEEGGKVVRVSSNQNLAPEKFLSPSELYNDGGFVRIKEDTINKSKILYDLGLNLNLAPVVDVSTDPSSYIYDRTLHENTSLTSDYAKTVIEASKNTGVSYTLKHFPGYANNSDTHVSQVINQKPYDDILKEDIPPFQAGINAKAEAVLVGHNIVENIDNTNPASLSPSVHNLLRNELKFTGVIMTDDISMGALNGISDVAVKAIQAGNDLIITTDYENSFNSIKTAINNNTLSEEQIDKAAFRVLAWKYYKLLILNNQK